MKNDTQKKKKGLNILCEQLLIIDRVKNYRLKFGQFSLAYRTHYYYLVIALLFMSSMCKSNCDRVPTNDFLHVFGEERLSLDDDLLIGLSWQSTDNGRLLNSGLFRSFTLLCTVIVFTMAIFPFFRPSLVYTSRSSSTSSNVSELDLSPPTANR